MDDADASKARPGEGAVRFSHSGYRYLLGFGPDFFGIWDREQPDRPILRFPRTDDGWDQAWYEYVSREKYNVEVLAPGAAYASTRTRGRWARWLLYLHIAGALATAGGLLFAVVELARVSAGATSSLREIEEEIPGLLALLLFIGFYPVPAAIAWLLWQHRAHRNLRVLGATELQYTPGWAVAWWFVPFALFVMPYRTVRELWKASDPDAPEAAWKQIPTPRLLALWWGVWLGGLVLLIIAAPFGRPGDVASLTTEAALGVAAALAIAFAGILAAALVRQIDARQELKRAEVGSAGRYVIRPPT
jgi:cobalamin synthase